MSKMNREKESNSKRMIFVIEILFVLGVFVYVFYSSTPKQIYPLSGMTIIDSDFAFEIEDGDEVMVSKYENFSEFMVLNESSEVVLSSGVYYWKVRSGFRESEVQSFVVEINGLNISSENNTVSFVLDEGFLEEMEVRE